jgi:hypothetical protein
MQEMKFNFYQRFTLTSILSEAAVAREEGRDLGHAHELLRLTDEEIRDSQLLMEKEQVTWTLPSAGYGTRDVTLSTSEAQALARAIENHRKWPLPVKDWLWLEEVVRELKRKGKEEDHSGTQSNSAAVAQSS